MAERVPLANGATGWRTSMGANLGRDGPSKSAHMRLALSGRIADVTNDEAGPR